jgi:hypothetical protein
MPFPITMLLISSSTPCKKIPTIVSASSSCAGTLSFLTFSRVIKTYDFIIFSYKDHLNSVMKIKASFFGVQAEWSFQINRVALFPIGHG